MAEQGFAIIDFETTGFNAGGTDRVVEVAVVHADVDGRVTGAWDTLVNPGRDVGATRIHGITGGDVMRAPTFAQIAPRLVELLAGRVLVAHNAPFDVDFLDLEFARTAIEGVTDSVRAIVDTRVVSGLVWPGEPAGLDALSDRLGVDRGARGAAQGGLHGALADARLLARCLPGLVAAIDHRLHPAAPRP